MKLSKKLLFVSILSSLLAPLAVNGNKKFPSEITVVADGSEMPVEYNDNRPYIKNVKSIQIVKII